ncbi:capsular polysaccharide biosynthesis protein, putative chain length regulator [Gracilibacillus halophilus YIM-C55.5]|uniref:Capsular polysaccharide biosynthesis protein, putative chain length regulator n=1 Tax=Gracilibacillus halophilus YIM-C55.5 TaxID=1308866 RepID=N4WYI9_9BACI|nr:Wzz/FepE/Etk N-terminal domain-containing protein [Gracilibacillus halophilus]ENH98096.1 capsular polysaccharide biosynthesis protein, putative chain length regulator [Gracilibacillus halophilus YIM-C55.5]
MEETISLKEIFEVLKKRIALIILLTIGAAIVSAVVSFWIITPTYESSTQFIVNQDSGEQETVNLNEIRSNVEIINTYNDIITSNRILDQVVEEVNLTISPGALAEKITVSSTDSSQVVTLTANDTDPDVATEIANTTVQIFQNDLPELMNVNNVNILTEATVSSNPTPVSPKPMLNIAIAIVLGLMIGVGLAFLLEYMDNTIESETDVEERMELPILGVVSHIDEKDMLKTSMNQPSAQGSSAQGSGSMARKGERAHG